MFGSAANNGQMIAEIAANHRTTEIFLQIAQRLTGRGETKKPQSSFLSPLLEKLRAEVVPRGVPSCLVSVAELKAIRGLRSPPAGAS